jgi:hypothetical protein
MHHATACTALHYTILHRTTAMQAPLHMHCPSPLHTTTSLPRHGMHDTTLHYTTPHHCDASTTPHALPITTAHHYTTTTPRHAPRHGMHALYHYTSPHHCMHYSTVLHSTVLHMHCPAPQHHTTLDSTTHHWMYHTTPHCTSPHHSMHHITACTHCSTPLYAPHHGMQALFHYTTPHHCMHYSTALHSTPHHTAHHHSAVCTTPRHARLFSTNYTAPLRCRHHATAQHSTPQHYTHAQHFITLHHITSLHAQHHTTACTALLNLTRLDCFSGHDRVSEKESSSLSQIVNESLRNSSFTRQALTLRTPSDHLFTPSYHSLFFFFSPYISGNVSSVMQARSNGHLSIDGHTDIDIDASLWLEWNGMGRAGMSRYGMGRPVMSSTSQSGSPANGRPFYGHTRNDGSACRS